MKKSKLLGLILVLVLTLTTSAAVFAINSSAAVYTGTCGANLTWTLDTDTEVLDISGSGKMVDYSYGNAPWSSYRYSIKTINLQNGVTSIGNYAFSECYNLTSITIPDSVTSIGTDAFYNCTGLTNITIPDSVTSIGSSAFSSCSGLTSITIPDSVTSIGSYAFSNCTGLTSITIPDSVTSIGIYAFSGCTGLTSITIPDSVTSIGEATFAGCTRLISITIPDSVTSIDNHAFYGCTGLTSITIPDSVMSIGYSAFYDCIGLTSITIPDSVTAINDSVFRNCIGLTSISIPDSVTRIGSYAFYGCTGLTSITIPDSVTSIGIYTFSGCTGLTSITIPDSVTSIDSSAFYGCTGLTSIIIPNSVTYIGSSAFQGCTGLTSIAMPDSVNYMGNSVFYGCTGLKTITLSKNLTSIGENAFQGCTSLKSISIPNGVTQIGNNAFYNCSALTILSLPDNLTTIGTSAFRSCTGLTDITLPNSITSIAPGAFRDCTGLTSITIPTGLTSIPSSAFRGCTELTNVTIPKSVTSIGNSAFEGCSKISKVYYNGSPDELNFALSGTTGNEQLLSADIEFGDYYVITWIVDGLKFTETYGIGSIPAFKGSTHKAPTSHYFYTFKGWDEDVVAVSGDATYTAEFIETFNTKYTITWIVDGQIIEEIFEYGTMPYFRGCTYKPSDAQFTYIFDGWVEDIVEVGDAATYTAKYKPVLNKYTVTWIVDGTETTAVYEYGETPAFTGGTAKAPDVQYTYTFDGWDKVISTVTGDVTYTAKYTTTTNKYTITWIVNGNETTAEFEYGTVPTFTGSTGKAPDAQYTYVFIGWNEPIVEVKGNATYTSRYLNLLNKYTVTWNVDGVISTEDYYYGETPLFKNSTAKPVTAQFTYIFDGWDKPLDAVAGNTTYTAQFESTVNKYTVTWDVNGTKTTVQYEYGIMPIYGGTTAKPANAQYTYTFKSWSEAPSAVTGDVTYTAQFEAHIISYTVIWDVDGTKIPAPYEYGEKPEFDGETGKAADAQYTYTFIGWNEVIVEVTGDKTYTAQYLMTLNRYTVIWNVDGVISTEDYYYGETPDFKNSTAKPADAQFTYTFDRWDNIIVSVTGNVTYTAEYSTAVNKYTVTWDVNGTKTTAQYDYGTTPSYTGSTDKAADEQFTYEFDGWVEDISAVDSNVTYTAKYKTTTNKYTITWIIDGEETSVQYEYGTTPEIPGDTDKAADAQYTYTFIGWDEVIAEVKGDKTYTAQYSETLNKYTVTWDVDGVISTETYSYGEIPSFKNSTDKPADAQYTYTFENWDKDISEVDGDATYTAQYVSAVNKYTVTWIVDGKQTTEEYEYGATPVYGGETAKAADEKFTYEFDGWDREVAAVSGDFTYIAKYKQIEIKSGCKSSMSGGIFFLAVSSMPIIGVALKKKKAV